MSEKPRWEINFQPVSIKMADGSVLTGMINIRSSPRLSDFLREAKDQFVVVVEDQKEPPGIFIVNKNYIMWAEPPTH